MQIGEGGESRDFRELVFGMVQNTLDTGNALGVSIS